MDRKQINGCLRSVGRDRKEGLYRGRRNLLRVMDMFTILRVVMVSWIYTNVKIHHIVHLNYVDSMSIIPLESWGKKRYYP